MVIQSVNSPEVYAKEHPSIIRLLATIGICLFSVLCSIEQSQADDPAVISGWRQFQLGATFPETTQACDPGFKYRVIEMSEDQSKHDYEVQAFCQGHVTVGPTVFEVQLFFTMSGHLFDIALFSDTLTDGIARTVLIDLNTQYGSFDVTSGTPYTTYCWPQTAGSQLNFYRLCGGGDDPDESAGHRIMCGITHYGNGLRSILIDYMASAMAFDEWLAEPLFFRMPGEGQF